VGREKAANDAIGAASVTRLIIAHRPETIRASSRVIVLERGKVAEGICRALRRPGPQLEAWHDVDGPWTQRFSRLLRLSSSLAIYGG
jgi:hypothetical protein